MDCRKRLGRYTPIPKTGTQKKDDRTRRSIKSEQRVDLVIVEIAGRPGLDALRRADKLKSLSQATDVE